MKTFKVFGLTGKDPEAVKVGFSWPALFLSGIWLLLKGLWVKFLMVFAAMTLVVVARLFGREVGLGGLALLADLAQIAIWVWVAVMGNEWRANRFLARGYALLGTVEASNPQDAVDRLKQKKPQTNSFEGRIEPS